ncbi:hypothetical protein [Thermococcus sp. Bubb.Bath]|uniref:hypothetical protein n=1 Tax=Thermococcus sp. Bubb.Bath TaxID=1638242 RepID=UPI0031837512
MEREGLAFDDKTLSTGFPKLDEILGGGLLPDSNVLVVYSTYSMGWLLPFAVLRERIKLGDFGVIMNTVFPFSALNIELKPIGLDIIIEGGNRNLAIIDIFASIHGVDYGEDFVLVDKSIDAQTFVPKYISLYSKDSEGENWGETAAGTGRNTGWPSSGAGGGKNRTSLPALYGPQGKGQGGREEEAAG